VREAEDRFNSHFSTWSIRLPPDDVANRRRGKIVKAGWAIWYLFGSDEKGEYLDYYAAHRMTNDRHLRIHANGEEHGLDTFQEFRLCSQDPAEDKRLETAYYAENQRVAKLLHEKGFGLAGDEPGGVQINRALREKKLE
jgi:hypothetical protein